MGATAVGWRADGGAEETGRGWLPMTLEKLFREDELIVLRASQAVLATGVLDDKFPVPGQEGSAVHSFRAG